MTLMCRSLARLDGKWALTAGMQPDDVRVVLWHAEPSTAPSLRAPEVAPLGCSVGADHPRVGWRRSCLVTTA